MKKIIAIFLIIVVLGIILFLFSQTSLVKEEMYQCIENTDCISVSADCCGCGYMGKATAINKHFMTQWDSKTKKECKDTFCPAALSNHPSCFAQPKCTFGTCKLLIETGEKYHRGFLPAHFRPIFPQKGAELVRI